MYEDEDFGMDYDLWRDGYDMDAEEYEAFCEANGVMNFDDLDW